jgi:hypothetical protein
MRTPVIRDFVSGPDGAGFTIENPNEPPRVVRGTYLYREPEIISKLPIVQSGPPGTFVVFADGARVRPNAS